MIKNTNTVVKKIKSEEPVADKPEHDYEAENAAETLMKAEQIKADKELMPRVHAHVGRKLKALQGLHKMKRISDISKYKNKKYGPKESTEIESPMEELSKDEGMD